MHILGVFNPIRLGGEGLLNPPPPNFCPHVFHFGANLLCVRDFAQKIACGKKNFIGCQDLDWVSQFNVNVVFIIFRDFKMMLDIVNW